VPDAIDASGHIDSVLPAEVRFTGLALVAGLDAAVEAADDSPETVVTCRNVYCHGASLEGGSRIEPAWNDGSPAQFVACGACHGIGPATLRSGGPHPDGDNCATCHGEVVDDQGRIKDPGLHIDGRVQVSGTGTCNSCHGNAENDAPPVDLAGRSDTSLVSVGAHQNHLTGASGAFAPVACADCHATYTKVDDDGHADGTVQVPFGQAARRKGASPTWDRGSGTCANTYCHGATLPGGSNTSPAWTVVDGTQIACGTCHGNPPPAPHPSGTNCSTCHDTAGADGSIAIPAQHGDGILQVKGLGCNSCHGSETNSAPPVDTTGSSDTTRVSVGAHQAHLTASTGIAAAVECSQCHVVPPDGDMDHVDGAAPVTFGDLSKTGDLDPAWDRTAATCTNTWCHGAGLAGGFATAPKWTQVDGAQSRCGACHGNPPPAPHPPRPDCRTCHETAGDNGTIAQPDKHIDGIVQVGIMACNSCHGSVDNNAPPLDTAGRSATSLVSVGAHQAHLNAPSGIGKALECSQCHVIPADDDMTHSDGAVQLEFGAFSRTGGLEPSWDRANATCTNTYCHGASLAGGQHQAPEWNVVDGTQRACNSCHGRPPATGRHPGFFEDHNGFAGNCTMCHQGVTNTTGTAIANLDEHLNGTVFVGLALSGTWDPVAKTCDVACHGGAGALPW
jgi:predicted CxxxxCH...CXXCH cytochrome family protein